VGLLDKVKGMFSGKKGAQTKAQAQKIAQQIDDQAEKLAKKDGTVGNLAGKAHKVIDKVDGD
jgi:hypothetical protein